MPLYKDTRARLDDRVTDLLGRMTLEEKTQQLGADAPANDRLGIPLMRHGEILHGVLWNPGYVQEDPDRYQGVEPTVFPQTLAMGCTFDPELVERMGSAIAAEARSLGRHHCYSPNLDIACDLRFGRVEENFGEDPHLVSRLGVAIIHGFQGRGDQRFDSQHVLATAKHFAGYGLVRGGINGSEVHLGPRDLREMHLPPFEAAVREAGIASVMPSHHAMDGVPCHASRDLLEEILRREWGFDGFVVSDNIDVFRLYSMQRVAGNLEQAACLGLQAGVDQELVLGRNEDFFCYRHLPELVRQGQISEETLDRSVRRILRAKFLLGLFDTPRESPDPRTLCNSSAHRRIALEGALASHVLLENDGLLPLSPQAGERIALIGPHADLCEYGGYVGQITPEGITPLQGIKEATDPDVEICHEPGCTLGLEEEADDEDAIARAVQAAREADTVILALGGTRNTCGEGRDNADLRLPGRQHELAHAVLDCGKPVVLVLIGGRPWAIGDIAGRCNAVLLAWYGGVEAGRAIAQSLLGLHNPGGKLCMSFPRSTGHSQCSYLHKPLFNGSGSGRYRQHENRALYPFGYGLSYTRFEFGPVELSSTCVGPAGSVQASVTVKNVGQVPGDEVVQCYVTDEFSSVTQPLKRLRGFQRIRLEPGLSRKVDFQLGPKELAIWDARMERTVEPGWFTVQIGPSSQEGSEARFEVRKHGSPGDQSRRTQVRIGRDLDMEAPQ